MNVNETALLKKLVNCKSEPATHAEDAAKKIRARTKMRDFAQKFGCVSLFLERIGLSSAAADNFDFVAQRAPSFVLYPATATSAPLDYDRSSSVEPLNCRA